jgi:hypothetical protein
MGRNLGQRDKPCRTNCSKAAIHQSLFDLLPRGVVLPFRKNNGGRRLSYNPIRYAGTPFVAAVLLVEGYDPNDHFDPVALLDRAVPTRNDSAHLNFGISF